MTHHFTNSSKHRTSSILSTRFRIAIGSLAALGTAMAASCSEDDKPADDQSSPPFVATVAASNVDGPVDATPSPDGTDIFYIAMVEGQPAIVKTPSGGGGTTTLHAGAPLSSPRGIATSSDGATLYVADPSAESGSGVIFALPAAGGTPAVVEGTAGTGARALDVEELDDQADALTFVGETSDGAPAVLLLEVGSGDVTTLAAGAPLVEPDGIVTTTEGVFVTDRAAGSGSQPGRVFLVDRSMVVDYGVSFAPGTPAGIAINNEENVLIVSALNPETGASEVLLVNSGTRRWVHPVADSTFSGGVHCSHRRDVCAWAGLRRVLFIETGGVASSSPGGPGDVLR